MSSVGKSQSPNLAATASDSVDSLQSHLPVNNGSRGNSVMGRTDSEIGLATYHTGVLQKRRRKRGQGYARRFFSLDFASCTLSYYYSRNSSALRGAIPLSLAAISADEQRREISIDSGAEVWHLRAGNAKDFDDWTRALEKASNAARGIGSEEAILTPRLKTKASDVQDASWSHEDEQEQEQEWEQVEALVSRIVGTRDAVRRLTRDTAPAGTKQSSTGLGLSTGSPILEQGADYFASAEKKPFWKRKSSAPSTPQLIQRSVPTQLAVPTPSSVTTTVSANGTPSSPSSRRARHQGEASMHDHCADLLNDLDAVLLDFSVLLTNRRRRRTQPLKPVLSRDSIDSTSTGEFYDAETMPDRSQVMMIDRQSEEDTQPSEADDEFITDASSISSTEEDNLAPIVNGAASLFPVKPSSFDPLPITIPIRRRKAIPPATIMPPSLIGFLRKNVGKDLSTISMPVSANEPISLMQRMAEHLEYANMLNTASAHKNPIQRLLYVTAFAVSYFSSSRAKERAIRKPFNPMLGETFELLRTENEVPGGFRLLVEKVSHRPVVLALQADSANWSFSQTPAPTQKFWGKSAELITDGRVRTALRLPDGSDEFYSWNVATVFLRNVVVGEKYVEPVGNMTVTNESTGAKATVEFKQKGMFGGRSDEVQIESYGPDGGHTGIGLTGTWTSSLRIVEAGRSNGAEIWHAGNLVDNAAQTYGLTTFAASLNEITELEKGKLPPTDSRLRPDQRAAENGDLESAEAYKAKLEEKQRIRRKELEERGETHKPRWFVRVDGGDEGEEVWKLKVGREGYWEERARGTWEGVDDILAV